MKHITADKFRPFPGIDETVYGRADFEALSRIVYDVAGIVMPVEKATLIYSRIAPLVRQSGCQTFARYIDCVRKDKAELRRTINALTTNHTFFYRESHHFEHLAAEVRPRLIEKALKGQPVRIWSAGCSTGEELWSLAMTLLGPDRAEARALLQGDVRILATDLADHAVEAASLATYAFDALNDVPTELMRAWTKHKAGVVTMADPMRAMVQVKRLNLLGPWPMKQLFDVIFCRNVMIYFDQPTKDRLVERFAGQLHRNGHLYIGHSERVSGPAEHDFDLVGGTVYRKVSA